MLKPMPLYIAKKRKELASTELPDQIPITTQLQPTIINDDKSKAPAIEHYRRAISQLSNDYIASNSINKEDSKVKII